MTDIRYEIGDSRKLLKKVKNESIHLIITSPPYWNAKNYSVNGQIGYDQSYDEYISDLNDIWGECARVLVPNGKICINIQPLPISEEKSKTKRSAISSIMPDIEIYMRGIGFSLSNIIIWDKRKYNNQMIFGSYPYPPNLYSHISFEYIYIFRKPGTSRKVLTEIKEKSKITKEEWRDWCLNSIWDIPPVIKFGKKQKEPLSHIAPFPIEIPRRLIRMFSFVNDTVFDPFLGCGTTLAACILESRKGIGFELNPDYEKLIKLYIRNPSKVPKYKEADTIDNIKSLDKFFG